MFSEIPLTDIKHGLGFRAMYKKDGKYVSPTNTDYVWDETGVAVATCQRTREWASYEGRLVKPHERGESWHSEIDIPHRDCTCGIYAAFTFGSATLYEKKQPQAVLFLVETYGKTIYYDLGMRSAKQRVRACVGNEQCLSDTVAANYFQVPFMALDVAKVLMDIQNYRVSQSVREKWDYTPFYIPINKAEELYTILPPLDYIEEEDPSLTMAAEWPFK